MIERITDRLKGYAANARDQDPNLRRRGWGALLLVGASMSAASGGVGWTVREQLDIRTLKNNVQYLVGQDGFKVDSVSTTKSNAERAIVGLNLGTCSLDAIVKISRNDAGVPVDATDYSVTAYLNNKTYRVHGDSSNPLFIPGSEERSEMVQYSFDNSQEFDVKAGDNPCATMRDISEE